MTPRKTQSRTRSLSPTLAQRQLNYTEFPETTFVNMNRQEIGKLRLDREMLVLELEHIFPNFHFLSNGRLMDRNNQLKDYGMTITLQPKMVSGWRGGKRANKTKRKPRLHYR